MHSFIRLFVFNVIFFNIKTESDQKISIHEISQDTVSFLNQKYTSLYNIDIFRDSVLSQNSVIRFFKNFCNPHNNTNMIHNLLETHSFIAKRTLSSPESAKKLSEMIINLLLESPINKNKTNQNTKDFFNNITNDNDVTYNNQYENIEKNNENICLSYYFKELNLKSIEEFYKINFDDMIFLIDNIYKSIKNSYNTDENIKKLYFCFLKDIIRELDYIEKEYKNKKLNINNISFFEKVTQDIKKKYQQLNQEFQDEKKILQELYEQHNKSSLHNSNVPINNLPPISPNQISNYQHNKNNLKNKSLTILDHLIEFVLVKRFKQWTITNILIYYFHKTFLN
jgi:hypothetical protein